MPTFATNTYITYNDVEFDDVFRVRISTSPELDDARRSVKWVKYTIDIDGYVLAPAASFTDEVMEDLRVALTRVGRGLQFVSEGFGTLRVNYAETAVTDANWGPIPEVLSWVPVGHDKSARVSFRVTCHIPECPETANYKGIAAYNYGVDFDIDRHGYQSRTISGYLLIAQTRPVNASNLRVRETADKYRERCRPTVPEGFQRVAQRFSVSPDKNRLNFSFTDQQMVRLLPEGVSDCHVSESISTSMDPSFGFTKWEVRFSGTFHTLTGYSRRVGLAHFLGIVKQRLLVPERLISSNTPAPGGRHGIAGAGNAAVGAGKLATHTALPVSLSMSEDVFGNSAHFEYTWHMFQITSIDDAVSSSGLWTVLSGSQLARSIDPGISGEAGLRLANNEEILVDLCVEDKPKPPTKNIQNKIKEGDKFPKGTSIFKKRPGGDGDGGKLPNTWIIYHNRLRLITENSVVRHKPLPQVQNPEKLNDPQGKLPDPVKGGSGAGSKDKLDFFIIDEGKGGGGGGAFTDNVHDGGFIEQTPPNHNRHKDLLQVRGTPAYAIVMEGYAARLARPIPVPRLKSVGGIEVEQAWATTDSWVHTRVGDVVVYAATWQIVYYLPEKFRGRAPDLANPFYDTPGGA